MAPKKTQKKAPASRSKKAPAKPRLPLPTKDEAFAVYCEVGTVYAARRYYRENGEKLGVRTPTEVTLYKWEKEENWQERKHIVASETEDKLREQLSRRAARKVLDAKVEVETVASLIFDKLKETIPDLPIKTASDARQLGLITKDYLELRDRLEGSADDKKAEEIAKTAEDRVAEAAQQSQELLAYLRQQHLPTDHPN